MFLLCPPLTVPPAGVMCLSQVSLGILALKLEKAGAVALVDRYGIM